ncbi:hypothetical protein AWJ15_05100 [Lacticaseibacillus rhamnosus]|uniref:hypothetical protein n=1 Tax=Lacticaseibacillus rhamnosus TaxID=47715 RepID=UPI000979BB13|nr:hypothetical protein [Lacticaseibacillus rhamnosus]AQG72394.1 hypothetical protein AWJ15_05100 [Lacticaseibacillus rhamnosus]
MKKRKQAVKKMVAENNELRKQLTKENRDYYENLLTYLRGKSFLRDDYQVEQNLLTILQDLIDAQADGVEAAAYFGQNPEATANDLLKTIPFNLADFSWFNLKLVFMMFFILWIPKLANPVMTLDIGMTFLCGVIAIIGSWCFVWLLGGSAFAKHTRIQIFSLIVFSIIVFAVMFFVSIFVKTGWRITLPSQVSLAVIVLGLVIIVIFPFVQHLNEFNIFFYLYVAFYFVLGLLLRLPQTKPFLTAKVNLGPWKWVVIIGLVLFSLAIGGLVYRFYQRRHPD